MIKFFARVMKTSSVDKIEIEQDLGIEIVWGGKKFYLQEDGYGNLILNSDNPQMLICPRASNSIKIDCEK